MNTSDKYQIFVLIFSLIVFTSSVSCNNNSLPNFTPDFIAEEDPLLPNTINFSNKTVGEFTFTQWDFGNGEKTERLQYNNKHSVFYEDKGDYKVTLSVWNDMDIEKSISKTVTIRESLFTPDFDIAIEEETPNSVQLTNTTSGEYDLVKWSIDQTELNKEPSNPIEVYLAFKGTYDITLTVSKENFERSITKQVTIQKDDPDYISKYELVWEDEFDSTGVDYNNWTFETGKGGWGNNELQNYTNGDNAEVQDGHLIITARKVDDNKIAGSYTSSRMVSKGKQEFKYGKIEVRAKLPSGTGIWPAIWMLGSNIDDVGWPACGEIDIMEYVGYEPDVIHSTVHTPSGYGANGNGRSKNLATCEEEFHIYGLIWTPVKMIFYVDSPDNVIYTYAPSEKNDDNWPFDKPQFMILNVAVGGNWGGAKGIDNSIFPQTMEVDFVRISQLNY